MREVITSALRISLLRTLEADPGLSVSDAVESVVRRIPEDGGLGPSAEDARRALEPVAGELQRNAIPHPQWLANQFRVTHHFFLVNTQPGWLPNLVRQTRELGGAVSHYILYGIWDSLLILAGMEEEAARFREAIQSTSYYDLSYFTARSVPFYHRYKALEQSFGKPTLDETRLNRLIMDYDAAGLGNRRSKAKAASQILGPAWRLKSGTYPGVTAYVGIILHGSGQEVAPRELTRKLRQGSSLRPSLSHVFEVDRGLPFHYFTKLRCVDLDELDRATDEISAMRIGRVSLEGNTFLVSSGTTALPQVRRNGDLGLAPILDLRWLEEVTKDAIAGLGQEAVTGFNSADVLTQLTLVSSVVRLREDMPDVEWTTETAAALQSSIEIFTREALRPPETAQLGAAVSPVAQRVEKIAKTVIREAAESVLGDRKRAVEELRLPGRYDRITLGKAVPVLRTMAEHPEFSFLRPRLTDDRLELLESFSQRRNYWSHGKLKENTADNPVESARQTIILGAKLLAWLEDEVSPSLSGRTFGDGREDAAEETVEELPKATEERGFRVFMSYSHKDAETARRIAGGLQAISNVFFDTWSIRPGESLVERINDGLAKNDALVVLLSRASTTSKWVRRELSSTLMKQLSGQRVVILPVLLEDCPRPSTIREFKYVDMRDDFDTGFVELLGTLTDHKKRWVRELGEHGD